MLEHDSSNRAGPFSPDGRWLSVVPSFSTSHQELWLVDLFESEPPRLQWAAGVDLVGIANFVTFLENTGPWRRHLREAEYGSLERDRDFLEEISPINKVAQIRSPLLVIQGANDPRVPIGEAEQIVARVKSLGRTVEFLRLEDEGHQIAKLKNKLVAYPMAAVFLKRHLMGEAVPPIEVGHR